MTNGIGRFGVRSYVAPLPTIWNNLTNYYSADNTANDSKGTAHGTLTNGATYSTGKINNGFSFDGVNDYVTLPSNSTNLGTSFTVSAWIYRTSSTALQIIYSNLQNTPLNGFLFGLSNGRLFIQIRNSGSSSSYNSTDTVPLNTWTFLSVVVDSTTSCKGYINNVEVINAVPTFNVNYPPTTYPVIGAYKYGTTSGDVDLYFPGIIDEVALFNSALSTTQLTELYNSGAGKQYVAPTPTYTTRTAAFATATGITDTTILNALNTFDTGLISNGLATKMKALYPFVGGTSNTHKFNFMDARDVDAAFRLAFNGGWIHSSTGALPNGTNGYANTNFNHVNNGNDKNNFGLTIYSRTNSTGFKVDIGAVTDAYSWIVPRASSTLDFMGIYDNSIFSGNFATSSLGLFTCLRNSLTSQKFFQNGILKGQRTGFSSNQPYGTDININIYISCRNCYSVASNFSDRQLAFSGIHDSLTDAEALTFYNLVQAMQTSLSRQV